MSSFHEERDYGQIAPILTDFPLNRADPHIFGSPTYGRISGRVGAPQLALSSIIVYLTEEHHSVEIMKLK